MLMQNFGVTNKEHYGMLWYFWSGQLVAHNLIMWQPHFRVFGTTTATATRTSKQQQQNNKFARTSRFFVHFFAVTSRLQRENA